MIVAVGIESGRVTLQADVAELCDCYDLTLCIPIILFPEDGKVIFLAEVEDNKLENLDALEADVQVKGVWRNPEFLTEFGPPTPKDNMSRILDSITRQ